MNLVKEKPPSRLKSTVNALASWVGRTITLKDGGFWSAYLGFRNRAGKDVNEDSVLQLSTAWACVRLISETIATLPLMIYRNGPNGTKERDNNHPLYALLHTQPNSDMSAAVFWQSVVANLLLHGVSRNEVIRTGDRVTSVLPVRGRVIVDENGNWEVGTPEGKIRVIPKSRQWEIIGFTLDGITPCSPIRYGAQVLGAAIAGEDASADTFRNGMKSPGVLSVDTQGFKEGQREQMAAHAKRAGEEGRVMVLEKGASFHPLTMTPQDSQLLSTRHFSVEEICRWFSVPPFMVGHTETSTSWGTGIERQMIGFVTFTLRTWLIRIEQSIRKDLMSPGERATLSAEFIMEGLLRGDSAARASYYSTMTQNGLMTRDECRQKENLPPMGGNAAVLTVQTALAPLDSLGQNTATPVESTP
jgi:HK97 family phage portal protein